MSDLNQPSDMPGVDQDSVIVEVLREYVRPGLAESTIRTVVPIGVGGVLAWIATHWNIVVPAHASSTFVVVATGVVTAGYYIVARVIERKFPRVGRVLLALGFVRAKPVYAEPATVKAVRDGSATPVKTSPTTP